VSQTPNSDEDHRELVVTARKPRAQNPAIDNVIQTGEIAPRSRIVRSSSPPAQMRDDPTEPAEHRHAPPIIRRTRKVPPIAWLIAAPAPLVAIILALESAHTFYAVVLIVVGVSLAYFASCLMMRTTIVTEQVVPRGVESEYEVSPLAHVTVGSLASTTIRSLEADARVGDAIQSLARHQAYPVIRDGRLIGVITSRELLAADPSVEVGSLITRPSVTASAKELARVAAERMANEGVGRLVIVDDDDAYRVIGMLTRSDLVTAFARDAGQEESPTR
jgi:CBS domain-containing protein